MNQSATHTWILTLGLSLLLVGSGLAMLTTPLLSSAELLSAGQRMAVRDAQFEEEPELPDPIIPIPENPGPKVPEPSVPEPNVPEPNVPEPNVPEPNVPEPNVPEPSVPEPSVPEPSVPEPNVPEPENPESENPEPGAEGRHLRTLLQPAPQPRANRRLQIGSARTPAMI
jgi:outer membrane biosynthesis protein TonB